MSWRTGTDLAQLFRKDDEFLHEQHVMSIVLGILFVYVSAVHFSLGMTGVHSQSFTLHSFGLFSLNFILLYKINPMELVPGGLHKVYGTGYILIFLILFVLQCIFLGGFNSLLKTISWSFWVSLWTMELYSAVVREGQKCETCVYGLIVFKEGRTNTKESLLKIVTDVSDTQLSCAGNLASIQALDVTVSRMLEEATEQHRKQLVNEALHIYHRSAHITNIDMVLIAALEKRQKALIENLESAQEAWKRAVNLRKPQVEIETAVECPVCYRDDIASNLAILRPCNHCLCAVCACKILSKASRSLGRATCPLCRGSLSEDILHPEQPLNSNRELQAYLKTHS